MEIVSFILSNSFFNILKYSYYHLLPNKNRDFTLVQWVIFIEEWKVEIKYGKIFCKREWILKNLNVLICNVLSVEIYSLLIAELEWELWPLAAGTSFGVVLTHFLHIKQEIHDFFSVRRLYRDGTGSLISWKENGVRGELGGSGICYVQW